MTFSDYLIDLALIGIVVLQVRGRRLTLRAMLLPVVLVGWVASSYLKSIPTSGNDLLLIGLCTLVGAILGTASGLTTSVRRGADGVMVAKAGAAAAVLWVIGMALRMAFQVYASHGGAAAIGRFSVAHHITTGQAWVAALVLMAIAEALSRTAILGGRAWRNGSAPLKEAASSGMMTVGERIA